MQVGSLVETVADFSEEKRIYGHEYPDKGDILTIGFIADHPNPENRKLGIVLLHFEELPGLVGICDKQIDGTANFIELLPPITDDYKEAYPQAKNIRKPNYQSI